VTLRIRFAARLLCGGSLLAAPVLSGCAQQSDGAKSAPALEVAVAPADPAPADPKPVLTEPLPSALPTAAQPPAPKPQQFEFPGDLGGKAISRVVTPDVARPLPPDRFGAAPRPRAVPAKVLEPDTATRAIFVPPPLLPPKPAPTRPTAPAEKVPLDIGVRADNVPARPALPVAPVVTERARDVNVPPPAPALGRPATDRVTLDDPTSELGNAVVVGEVVKVPVAPSGFQKVSVPDPFEFGEQVKPKVPPAAEPSAAPVPVNPQRVK
jgi:hypothetical protein